MTPSDYAIEELMVWEGALQDQRDAERRLSEAGQLQQPKDLYELLHEVECLQTRADLLLAQAVKVKCAYRDRNSPPPGAPRPRPPRGRA